VNRQCNRCGQAAGSADRFCSACGSTLPQPQAYESAVDATGSLDALVDTGHASGPLTRIDDSSVSGVAPGSALLIIRRGPGEGSTFTLDAEVVTVGRSPGSALFLDDVTVSRRHAEFTHSDGKWRVQDSGSLNGTYVNRVRIEGLVELHGGDELQIGKYRFAFLVAAVV
jgi:hypothetical protein